MRAARERKARSVDRGRCRQSIAPRNRPGWVPTRSEHAAGDRGCTVMARWIRTWRGRRPLACADTRCAEPGRPCLWPGAVGPGPHGEPTGYDRDGRVQGVGQPQSIGEAPAQGCWCARTGVGGGEQGAGQGEPGRAPQGPDTAPGNPATGARWGTAGALRLRVITRGRSPVRSCRTPGSVRGVLGNRPPYRDLPEGHIVRSPACAGCTACKELT